ncbi:MAG: MATE family efflux transporter [delta proteobacterium ML8_F1]|nr:MAG: MATE family efflux transporter [delta proteobacterium ML8_F1]
MKTFEKDLIRSIFFLALPAILEMALHTMLGVADTIMISRLINTEALSGSGYANQIVFMIIFIFSSFNIGAIAMISRAYGEKNHQRVNLVANQNTLLNIILGIIIATLSYLSHVFIFSIFDITEAVLRYAVDYYVIITWGLPFMFVSFALSGNLRGIGDTKTPMLVVAFSNILNIILNYVLITGVWIFPEMGIKGAALATSISRLLGAGAFIVILTTSRELLRLHLKAMKLTREIFRRLISLSLPGAIEQLFMQTSFVAVGIIISKLTTLEEAAFRILLSIESISFMPAVGISIAAATLVGQALGEKNIPKALNTSYIASIMALIWGLFIGGTLILFPGPILLLFTPEIPLIEISIGAMIAAGINQPFLNPSIVLTGALRGAGDTQTVLKLVTLRLWIFFVPLTYLFVMIFNLGIKSMWIAETLSFVLFIPILLNRIKGLEWTKIQA